MPIALTKADERAALLALQPLLDRAPMGQGALTALTWESPLTRELAMDRMAEKAITAGLALARVDLPAPPPAPLVDWLIEATSAGIPTVVLGVEAALPQALEELNIKRDMLRDSGRCLLLMLLPEGAAALANGAPDLWRYFQESAPLRLSSSSLEEDIASLKRLLKDAGASTERHVNSFSKRHETASLDDVGRLEAYLLELRSRQSDSGPTISHLFQQASILYRLYLSYSILGDIERAEKCRDSYTTTSVAFKQLSQSFHGDLGDLRARLDRLDPDEDSTEWANIHRKYLLLREQLEEP